MGVLLPALPPEALPPADILEDVVVDAVVDAVIEEVVEAVVEVVDVFNVEVLVVVVVAGGLVVLAVAQVLSVVLVPACTSTWLDVHVLQGMHTAWSGATEKYPGSQAPHVRSVVGVG